KGKHRGWPLRLGLWFGRSSFEWIVKFDESCRYNLPLPDHLDTNKLVGIGYLWHHHKDSARFGWRYNMERDCIELLAYCYVGGERVIRHIAYVNIGRWVTLTLSIHQRSYAFYVDQGIKPIGMNLVTYSHNKMLQYRLGP